MNYPLFRKYLSPLLIFSLQDAKKYVHNISTMQLYRWKEKGYLRQLAKGYYSFVDTPTEEYDRLLLSNILLSPSYITAESALAHYQLIPEYVYQTTACTTKNTKKLQTYFGEFSYNSIKPELFTGYTLLPHRSRTIRIAEPEKALLDLLYKHKHLKTKEDFEELRLNPLELSLINTDMYTTYMQLFSSPSFEKRASILLQYIHAQLRQHHHSIPTASPKVSQKHAS